MKNVIGARYLVLYVAMVAMCFVMVAGIGYYAGPAHLGSNKYEEGMADILLSGSDVGNPGSFDFGTFEKYHASQLRDGKDVVILGSSRSMMVSDHLFPGRSLFNSWVSGGALGDCLAVYELYEERGLTPSVVVLGVEPWWFNGSVAQLTWGSLREPYLSMLKRLNLAPSSGPIGTTKSVVRDLLSLPYFKQSLQTLILNRNRVPYFATDRSNYSGVLMLQDGSWFGPRLLGPAPPEQAKVVEAAAITQAEVPDAAHINFTQLDQERITCLEAFVDHLRSENVEVVFYLAPFHPSAYKILVQKDPVILQAEAYYRNLARDRGISVVGSYNPQQCSCTKEDFYDGFHPTASGVDKAFSKLECTPPAKCHIVE